MGICLSCRRRDRKAPEKRAPGAAVARVPAKGAAAELLPRRVEPAMANSISNIKMTNPIKGIVSKRRKRYIKDGFNLDLAYITDRLIAMGFPAEKLEGVYRNHIDEVYRFLEQMHKDRYKIYNLCSERSYDSSKFHERVVRYAFEDHTPPYMEIIQPFCEDVHKWLNEDVRNVAAIHCKAGKGRTGTMVCCYLLYSGQKATADEALKFYGTKRTHDEKGVTIPSQRRYVEYYAFLVRSGLQYTPPKVHIRELIMSPPPMLNGGQCTLELTITQAQPAFKAPSGCHEVSKHDSHIRIALRQCTPLRGDVRVDVYNKPKMMMRKEKLFHFWFNTFFVANCVGAERVHPPADSKNLETFKLTLNKWQLDDAHKDKQNKLYSQQFKVELILQKQPDTSTFSGHALRAPSPPSSSASTCSEPDTEPDAHWDSGEGHVPYARLIDLPPAGAQPVSYPGVKEGCFTGPLARDCKGSQLADYPVKDGGLFRVKEGCFTGRLERDPRGDQLTDCSVKGAGLFGDKEGCFTGRLERDCKGTQQAEYSVKDDGLFGVKEGCFTGRLERDCKGTQQAEYSVKDDGLFGVKEGCFTGRLERDCKGTQQAEYSVKDDGLFGVKEGCFTGRLERNPRGVQLTDCSVKDAGLLMNNGNPEGQLSYTRVIKQDLKGTKDSMFGTKAASNVIVGTKDLFSTNTSVCANDALCTGQGSGIQVFGTESDMCQNIGTDNGVKTDLSTVCQNLSCPVFGTGTELMCPELTPDNVQYYLGDQSDLTGYAESSKKKHFFHKREDGNEKKIPKVSSDHTISDESKKKSLFHRKDDEGLSKPRLSFDMRASWREFSGKWTDNRKKKDRDDS